MRGKQFTLKIMGLIFCIMISLHCSLVYSAEPTSIPPGTMLPQFKLTGPNSQEAKDYLGLKDEKPFSLSQVKTKLMLVEFFDVFCPVCQKNAPTVNRLYNLIKEDKNLSKNIKLIGIALEGQPKDLEVYKKAYKVEFPLFPDPKKEIKDKVKEKIPFVPLLALLDKNSKVLMSHVGDIRNFDALLAEIRKISKAQQ
jgi:peroxiredoxin